MSQDDQQSAELNRIAQQSINNSNSLSQVQQQQQHQQFHHQLQTNSGHYDPNQRRFYLILFAGSCLSAITGLTLIFIWIFKFRPTTGLGVSNASQLANWHPILMFTFMVSLNMYAVLVYRTHFSRPKEQLKWTHAIISGVNVVMSLLGVFAMFKAHLMNDSPNFYSLHSWIGVLANTFYLAQFVLGFLAFMKPGMAQHRRAQLMPIHRAIGAGILILAGLAAITGIAEMVIFQDKKTDKYPTFAPITFIANFSGISVIVMTSITLYLLRAPQFMRSRLPEEEPLKR